MNWGLGHATRCIPVVHALLKNGYDVLLGSDGAALQLLTTEFPSLPSVQLPFYNITYPKIGGYFKINFLRKLPHIVKTIQAEKRLITQLVADDRIQGIISDNRFGIRSQKVPSVYITHQLQVLSGNTTAISSWLHQRIISKFTECWVPDIEGPINLSGTLGHIANPKFPVRYIGTLSRMKTMEIPHVFDVLCILSGPEPQRSLLEEKLLTVFKNSEKKIALVQGRVEEQKTSYIQDGITVYNFLETASLEKLINQSGMVVSRSGYTTIMDLAALQKPAFFIPTPGQYEQKYLAKKLKQQGLIPSCKQHKFSEDKLVKTIVYKGFQAMETNRDLSAFFSLFERE